MKLQVLLHNIRSTYNVGAILRTAEGLGVEKIIYSGYTPVYDDEKALPHLREKLNKQIAKVALGAEEMVTQEAIQDVSDWLERQKAAGWTIVGLENNLAPEEAARVRILGRDKIKTEQIVLILGEEVKGIPTEIRVQCDYFLEIPMRGRKESFNVSVAGAIGMWGLMNY